MLSCQKHLFTLPDDEHYLNCAYMSPLLRRVEAAGIEGIRRQRRPSSIGPDAYFEESDRLRRLFAQLVHAEADRIAIIPSASYGLATAARNLRLRKGQNLVLLHDQFPSNVYIWRRLAEQFEAEIRTVMPPADHARGARWNDRILEAIDDATAVVAMGHVHWTDGTRFDLERISARTRETGAALIIDGTQSIGALPFDVQRLQPDALICAGYKWLFGPYGSGVAYYGPRFDEGLPLEENWIVRRGSEDFSRLVQYADAYQPGARRFDVGQRSNFIAVSMLTAALEQLLEWQPDEIQAYCRRITTGFFEDVRAMGFIVEEEAWRAAHLFGIRVPEHLSVERLKQALEARAVRVSVRGDAIRVSPHVYNDEHDIAALRDALEASLYPSSRVHSTPV